MPGPWRVLSQVIGDQRMYIAGRQLDPAKPLHGGNVEYSGEYTTDRGAVEKRVSDLIARGRHE
ncbi:MAG: hypothetical protein QMD46_12385 [Methanomicrobiales archaeon]|nr:hypothetical protein [Methanomicrobiales archaeon]